MGELLSRGYRESDAPALATLMNAVDAHGGGRAGYTATALNGMITTLVADPAQDSRLVFELGPDERADLIAGAFTTSPPAGAARMYLTGGVHPDRHGRGIGRELLGWQLDRARQLHAAAAPGMAWQAEARTTEGNRAAARLYRRMGLRPVRYWCEMAANTVGAPTTPVPDGLRLETYSSAYTESLYDAHMESFERNWAFVRRDLPGWLRLTVLADTFLPDLSLLGFDGAELAGYLLSYRQADPARVYVGQVGVRPSWRRRGLAGALLARMLHLAAGTGHRTVILSVDADSPTGALSVYERAGFTVQWRAVTHAVAIG